MWPRLRDQALGVGIIVLLCVAMLYLYAAIYPLAVWVVSLIWSILGFQKVNAGGSYRYPVSIRLIK